MSYAIRFRSRDPRDPSPALYLSTDHLWEQVTGRLTSVASDVVMWPNVACAESVLEWRSTKRRCRRDRLHADVVPLAEALADCGDVEPRP